MEFLQQKLLIQVNSDKMRITHLKTEKAHFLGVDIFRRDKNYSRFMVIKQKGLINHKVNNRVIMYAPMERLIDKLVSQGYAHPDKRPRAVTKWIYLKPEEIILKYNAVIRGVFNCYNCVDNYDTFSRFTWIMLFSAAFTLAKKLNLSPAKVFKKYGKRLTIKYGYEKSISLAISSTLAKRRMTIRNSCRQAEKHSEFDPFKVKYY